MDNLLIKHSENNYVWTRNVFALDGKCACMEERYSIPTSMQEHTNQVQRCKDTHKIIDIHMQVCTHALIATHARDRARANQHAC